MIDSETDFCETKLSKMLGLFGYRTHGDTHGQSKFLDTHRLKTPALRAGQNLWPTIGFLNKIYGPPLPPRPAENDIPRPPARKSMAHHWIS